ncbi:MAG: cytochrome c oxidase subunit, partial [Thermoplasmata archaeon]|nr:cytochrome c oxidase subunit [Thermoplasmata archaeon]
FTVYFTSKGLSAGHWPDNDDVHLPLLKTLIFSVFLFSSSWTIHKAEGHIKRGEHAAFRKWWLLTILLGAVFLAGQVWEYTLLIEEGATLGSSQFMSAFFLLTGTHGLHVFGGLCALTVVYARASKGQFNAERHAFPQAASMYWHFVDLVWVVVYGVVYLANIGHFGFTL